MMNIMARKCYLCGGGDFVRRMGTVRDNQTLNVLECTSCGLVFLSSFEHINNGFYEESGMHAQPIDVQTWLRQTACDDDRRFNQFRRRIENMTILDFGCGAGGFLNRARDVALRVCGVEVESRLAPYFHDTALDVRRNIDEFDEGFDVITLFHVLEHFPDPVALLRQLSRKLKPGGQIIVEVPNADDALLTLYQCEAFTHFTYWSCHLFLFNAQTLSYVAQKAGLSVVYLQHVQRYTLANHLYWLSKGRPGGHSKWHFLDSEDLSVAYEKALAALGHSDTLVCSLDRKPTDEHVK
jgi:2-polyprenyl-3-methyl-5-hydroxy-6-metoxy-1,4-benzoquinol methylase